MGEASTDTDSEEAIHQTLSAAISQSLKGLSELFDAESELFFAHVWKDGKEGIASTSRSFLSSLTKEKYKVTSIRTDEEEPCLTFASCSFFPSSFARTTSIPRKQEKGRGEKGGKMNSGCKAEGVAWQGV